MCGGSIIADFIPSHADRSLTASDLWPNSYEQELQSEGDMDIREGPWILEEDKWMPRFVKRARTEFDSQLSNWAHVEPESFSSASMGYKVQDQDESG